MPPKGGLVNAQTARGGRTKGHGGNSDQNAHAIDFPHFLGRASIARVEAMTLPTGEKGRRGCLC